MHGPARKHIGVLGCLTCATFRQVPPSRLDPSPSHRVPLRPCNTLKNGVQELGYGLACFFDSWPGEIKFTCQFPVRRCDARRWIRHFLRNGVRCSGLERSFDGLPQFCAVELHQRCRQKNVGNVAGTACLPACIRSRVGMQLLGDLRGQRVAAHLSRRNFCEPE